ncbi:MAG: tRNA pseudouridine(38-40) synthase TruA [Candidatus Eisenbacteria bacterium]
MRDRNLKLTIEYDGTDFSGWQVQPGTRTVQGDIEFALADLAGESTRVTGAGRTDAGVHALGQVASVATSLDLPAERIGHALNARLERDVRVVQVEDVPESFHARFDAVSRSYFYLIGSAESAVWRRNRWFVSASLDEAAMRDALAVLEGEHDFSSFCLVGSEPDHHRCRVTGISLECEVSFGGILVVRITANRFLRGMVRSVVGTLVEVGRGKTSPSGFEKILEARDRGAAGPTAPPHGLYLEKVSYD